MGFAKGTTFEGQINDVNDAASFVINQSQFNLDAFNRPQIAFLGNGLGAITLQFLPFVTMMIEVYANAIGKYGGSTFNPIKFAKSLGKEGSIDPRNMSPQGKRALVFTPNLTTVGSYKTVSPTALDTLFQNYIGKIPAGATDAQMCLAADHRLVKRSPVGTRTNAPIR